MFNMPCCKQLTCFSFNCRCRKVHAGRQVEKEEVNDLYGFYYTAAGHRVDESTVEVKDENPYYGR